MIQSYNPEKPFSSQILDLIKQTWNDQIISISGYPVLKDFFGFPYYMEHVDGTGTKGLLHYQNGSFEAAATDAFAMNVNDLAILGFTPHTLNCHLLLQDENNEIIFRVIQHLTSLCKKYQILYTGGETAILNTISGMEIGVHMSGYANKLINTPLFIGDLIYGHLSNGIHSNGLTLARHLLKDDLSEYKDEILKPTKIYLKELSQTQSLAKKRMHITGGAFTKLRNLLRTDVGITIDLTKIKTPSIFQILFKRMIEEMDNPTFEMLRTFNCGVGFIEVIHPTDRPVYEETMPSAVLLGKVTSTRKGKIQIKTSFEQAVVEI